MLDDVVWKHINTDEMDYCYERRRPHLLAICQDEWQDRGSG